MERFPVSSSNIKSVGYDAEAKSLEIEFANGNVYAYAGVPPVTHSALISAKSVGAAFATMVRGKFEYAAVPKPKPEAE